MNKQMEKAAVIRKYKSAYMRAYGEEIEIFENRGWFRLGTDIGTPYRLRQLDQMADNLNKRLNERGQIAQ